MKVSRALLVSLNHKGSSRVTNAYNAWLYQSLLGSAPKSILISTEICRCDCQT